MFLPYRPPLAEEDQTHKPLSAQDPDLATQGCSTSYLQAIALGKHLGA